MSLTHLKNRALANEAVSDQYEKLKAEYEFIDELLSMRQQAGLTQEQIAERMGTHKSNISRLERGRGNPSWAMLKKYAGACGYEIHLKTTEREGAL